MDRPVLGHGNCATGDCGNSLKCTVTGATPSTLAEFIQPQGRGSGECKYTGCVADLNADCPEQLRVMDPNNGGNVVGV
ncbi:hypothetical protein Bca4012_100547 [Brassica carinata]|uniref:Thaumatin-like protein n=2 Tax=Brassica TaxID=3705 RepID=A0A0D3CWK3_BRAOL|nr:unnamed protein product [Brassica napus]